MLLLLCCCCWLVQAESDVFATTGGDRSIALYDLRSARPIRKLVMQARTNTLAW
jgi:WD repeat and SOF domain-containing protein 1